MRRFLSLSLLLGIVLLACVSWAQAPLTFIPAGPCRVLDTRWHNGPFGGPPVLGGTVRTINITQNRVCGIPTSAQAYALNVTVVPRGFLHWITVWPTGQPLPDVSNLNSFDGRPKAVATIVGAGVNNSVDVYVTDTTDLIVDITGYFVAPGNPHALYYYPLQKACEVINTNNYPTLDGLGGPSLAAGVARSFQVTNSRCSIPSDAEAYSLNVIATPVNGVPMDYLTIWPSDQAQPFTSLLNSYTGTAVANAAIVGAGGGSISFFVNNTDTDIQVVINGYFAPRHVNLSSAMGSSSGAALYPITPCRAYDTRPYSFMSRMDYTMQLEGGCQEILPSIQVKDYPISAFVLNATVLPEKALGFFPIWATGQSMPTISSIVALDGTVASNLAIVPAGHHAQVSAFAGTYTNLLYDLWGYFASPTLTILTQMPPPPATNNVPYPPFTMQARGGVPPYTWSAKLPAGLAIDPGTGTISGCPVVNGAAAPTMSVRVTDSVAASDEEHTNMLVSSLAKLTITTASMPSGMLYVPYSEQLVATGGYGTYNWTLVSGHLPPGFSLSSNGVISGYDEGTRGRFDFTVQVSDQQCPTSATHTQPLHIHID